jgi:L,D-peptidoglycan transpeptidase YkuD (ErfK/YbiS/YcfS/YnhG family)
MLSLELFAADEQARGYLAVNAALWPCAIGAAGFSNQKIEGDGKTPLGTFALRRLWYRADRFTPPAGPLPQRAIDPLDGWSDDPEDPDYNKPVRRPHAFSHEHLWRDDGLYDAFFEIGYNDAPAISGAGSAIFLHLEKNNYQPTRGCVAISRDHMMHLIPLVSTATRLLIRNRAKPC